jgi:hypothetical protein
MVRTIWLAVICLAILGAAAAVRVFPNAPVTTGFASASADVASVMPADIDQGPAGLVSEGADTNVQTDTLGKADKLLVMRAAEKAPAETSYVDPISPETLTFELNKVGLATNSKSESRKLASRHWHDPLATGSTTKSREQRHAKTKNRERNNAIVAAAPGAETRSCSEGAALLRKLKMLPDCQSAAVNADAY